MDQVGYVSAVNNGIAQVEVRRASACGDKCGSCGGGCSVPVTRVKIKNTLGAEQGDLVEVRMSSRTVLKFAFLVYIIPLVLMVAGIGVSISIFKAAEIANYESYGFFVGLILLAVSYLILKFVDNKVKENDSINFQMVRIINE